MKRLLLLLVLVSSTALAMPRRPTRVQKRAGYKSIRTVGGQNAEHCDKQGY